MQIIYERKHDASSELSDNDIQSYVIGYTTAFNRYINGQ